MRTIFVIASQKLVAFDVANMASPSWFMPLLTESVSQTPCEGSGTDIVSSHVDSDDSETLSDVPIQPVSPWKLANSINSYNKFLVLMSRCLPAL
jgi:hypothetical protein